MCFTGKITKPSSNFRRTVLGIGMQAMQQLTGINFIFYYGTVFFKSLPHDAVKNPFLISMVATIVNCLTTPLAFYMVERVGRRRLLIFGGCGMIVSQL